MAGKPFEITYSPAGWSAPPGGIAAGWSSPYGGLNVQTPENLIGPQYTPAMNNFMFRNSELRTRPLLRRFMPGPDGTNKILGGTSFLSVQGVWHTVCWTANGMFQLQPNSDQIVAVGGNPWAFVGGVQMAQSNIVYPRAFQNILYYTNGNGHLSMWDGIAAHPVQDAAFSGATNPPPGNATTYGGAYLGELDSHLLIANVTEVTNNIVSFFPQRVRWSNIGFNPGTSLGSGGLGANLGTAGATFDPSININAGVNDFIDVPDVISGLMFMGQMGYIFRPNGITEVFPTGNGQVPFDFNHLWASEKGIGNVYPATIAQYGNFGVFVASDNVYKVSGQASIGAIGGGARDAIMVDLASTQNTPRAVITPGFQLGFTYLVYLLIIPLPGGGSRIYVYSFEDDNWAMWTASNVTWLMPAFVGTGSTPVIGVVTQGATGGVVPPPPGSGGTGGGGPIGGGGLNPPGPSGSPRPNLN